MRGRLRQILVAFLIVAGTASPALADGGTDLDAAFTAWGQGHREEAVRLFTRAIDDRLLPRRERALALIGRAHALEYSGDYQGAIIDYETAIELAPSPSAYRFRGIAYIAWGRFDDAADDFLQSLRLDPSSALSAMWLHIVRQKASVSDGRELTVNLARIDLKVWPGPVLAAMTGRGSVEAAARAMRAADPAVRTARHCDMAFFLGEQRLNDGDQDALRLLREARDFCPASSPERALARMDLLRGDR